MPSAALTLVHADIRDYLVNKRVGQFDGVISDAPYALGITADRRSGAHWDTSHIAFDATFWSALGQVVRRGGNLASFGHSRTGHRQTTAIEDGGWRIVDTVAHIKSHGYIPGNRDLELELLRAGLDDVAEEYVGYTTHLRPAYEPITLARNLQGKESLVRAIAAGGTGGFRTRPLRIPTSDLDRARTPGRVSSSAAWAVNRLAEKSTPDPAGRLPTNALFEHSAACRSDACDDACGLWAIDQQSRKKYADGRDRPSRFFSSLKYAPRAPESERPHVNGVSAPTVKSQAVLDWLCILVGVKPGSTWLDPFSGSGAVAEAIVRAGASVVSVDREGSYLDLTRERFRRLDAEYQETR
jgi:hypothetical protein